VSADLSLSRLIHEFEGVEIISDVKAPSHLEAAHWYARTLRWPVFPLVPRGKKPLTTHGFLEASTDMDTIYAWWHRWPDANLGTPTGPDGCGFDVVDIDGPTGMATLEQFAAELDVRAVAFTPGDGVERKPGRHLYIPATGDPNATKFAPGCDYRGAGGYVVLPPSVALHGVRYAWIEGPK
jgi:hypothetical protein